MEELEIEIKAYCSDLSKVKQLITELGADIFENS